MLFYLTCLIALCAYGSWSFYQVIYALRNGRVRRFGRQPVFDSADLGYCMRLAEPGWFRYHVVIYALQSIAAFVLPVYALFKTLF